MFACGIVVGAVLTVMAVFAAALCIAERFDDMRTDL